MFVENQSHNIQISEKKKNFNVIRINIRLLLSMKENPPRQLVND